MSKIYNKMKKIVALRVGKLRRKEDKNKSNLLINDLLVYELNFLMF